MPFTASHVAAILPLRRTPLVGSALVIGSMVPDAPLFAADRFLTYGTTHSLFGAMTYDAVLGLAVFVVWHVVLAPAALAALPAEVLRAVEASRGPGVRHRVSSVRNCVTLYLSLVVGALTHVIWDAFTHPGRWGVEHVSWLAQKHGRFGGYAYAWHASSIVGGLLVAWCVHRWLLRNGIRVSDLRLSRGARLAGLVVVSVAALNVVAALAPRIAAQRFEHVAYIAATRAIPAAGMCVLLLAVGWHVARLMPVRRDLR